VVILPSETQADATRALVSLIWLPLPNTMGGKENLTGESMSDINITALVESFAQNLVAAVEGSLAERVQAAIAGAFDAPQKREPGRPSSQAVAGVAARAAEKPKQLCLVPGCSNVAAPVFGMVCKDHKNVAKSKIAKYREERKATAATGAKDPTSAASKRVLSPKAARARKIQGQYMGALKSLTGADRAKVKQTAREKGVAEAVKLAKSLKKT
jgi:hypothetical protein